MPRPQESHPSDLTPAERQAVMTRVTRMNPRLMPPEGPLAELRALTRDELSECAVQTVRDLPRPHDGRAPLIIFELEAQEVAAKVMGSLA